ncbi:methyltransferase domain containing protein [Nitzschia inconspicua]|uniref:Methyltransferase domain containing protein n=1 Tax=Nitzschia inconspicua TaxID=303405 RepID=A0A9K3K4R5_9STRA|nr:methyltransferase domain containing protein [Nitzschia inconspicua]KAG7374744.1 methyltransferase domain containing protein [Nitzschia inconspicua]
MSARTSDNDEHHLSSQQTIQPFEWLTSPSSLLALLQEHVMRQQQHTDDNITLSQQQRPLQALHVGCGSSTVGEFLVQSLGFSRVINVDCDHDTMQRMEDRWNQRALSITSSDAADACLMSSRMEFLTLDFTKEHLPEKYNDSFDLVLDKSTLDCTLCSDTATAALLVECYRTLRSDGGVYMVISFHELDLLLPLLQDLPGAQWTVTHTTMERQVEQLPTTSDPSMSGSTVKAQGSFPASEPSHNNNNNNNRKPLNVLIARRSCVFDGCGNNIATSTLDFDAVYSHVHRVNDRWFQEQQPLLTELRIHELKEAFEKVSDIERNDATEGGGVSLKEAFPLLFTEAEREHLTFDHFLEDWEAFVQTHEGLGDGNTLTLETAIAFLTEMQ